MSKIFFRQFWQYSISLLTATSLAVTTLGVALPQPAFANSIQQRITELKNSSNQWIEIDLSDQRLYAWEGNKQVYAIIVSTGKAATPTPTGTYTIERKLRSDRMRGPGYDVPNVPYAMYYHRGYAIHGTYWHNNFGTPMSHGCTNVATDHAKWLYNWAPVGTPVVVHE